MSTSSEMSDHFSPDITTFLDSVSSISSKPPPQPNATSAAFPMTSKQMVVDIGLPSSFSSSVQVSTVAAAGAAPINSVGSKLFMDSSVVNVMKPSDLEYPSNLRASAFTFDSSSSSRPAAGVATVQDLSKLLTIHTNNHQSLDTTTTPKRNTNNLDALLDSEDSMSQLSMPSSCKSETMTRSTKSKLSTKSVSKTPLGTSSTRKREYLALTNNFNSFYNTMVDNQNCMLNAISEKNQEIISEISQTSQSINDMGFKINDFVAQQVTCLKMDMEREVCQVQTKNDQVLHQFVMNQSQLISHIQSLNQNVQNNQEEIKILKLMLTGSISIAIIGILTQFFSSKSPKNL